jgi:hypothetical protein
MTHGDRSREFLERPIDNLSLTANSGGGAISINIFKTNTMKKETKIDLKKVMWEKT